MQASEVLKKPGDVAVNGRGEVKVCTNSGGDDWQPLLTREEWKAAHLEEAAAEWERNCWNRPLALRKLEPGEALVAGRQYAVAYNHDRFCKPGHHYCEKWHEVRHAAEDSHRSNDYDYYELPDLSERELTMEEAQAAYDAAPAEPLSEEEIDKLVKHVMEQSKPAPNPVGERLMDPPEEGTPVVRFFFEGSRWEIFAWERDWKLYDDSTYFLWHGPIPEEPKPKPALPYPERLKVPGVAGIARDGDGDWCAYDQKREWKMGDRYAYWDGDGGFELLVPLLFPYLYAAPYSDVEASDSWIDNPAYEGGEA